MLSAPRVSQVEVSETTREINVTVYRRRGADGKVTVDYNTADGEAKAGVDYVETTGTLVFEHGETSQVITVMTHHGLVPELNHSFHVRISNPTGGLVMSKKSDAVVSFVPDQTVSRITQEVLERLQNREEASQLDKGEQTFFSQLVDAVSITPAVDEFGEQVPSSVVDLVLHFMTISWRGP